MRLILSSLALFLIFSAQPVKAVTAEHKLPQFYLGSKSAPVTVYEFMSLSCPFCAQNIKHLTSPTSALQPLIKAGKVKLVFMDFPIHGEVDFWAHKILYFSKSPEQFFHLVNLFAANQEHWFEAKNPLRIIINYAELVGIPEHAIRQYNRNQTIIPLLEKRANYYLKHYKIQAAPTTIVERSNRTITIKSARFVGVIPMGSVVAAINQLLA